MGRGLSEVRSRGPCHPKLFYAVWVWVALTGSRTFEQRLLQKNYLLEKFVNVLISLWSVLGTVGDSHITIFSGYYLVCGLSCPSEGRFRLKLGSLTTVTQTSLSDVEISL